LRTLWNVIAIFVVIHAVASLVLLGWLGCSDRLTWDRVAAVCDMFMMSVTQQNADAALATAVAEQALERKRELTRIQSLDTGPLSVASRLEVDRAAQELALASLQRYKDDMGVFRNQIDQGKRELEAQQRKVMAAKKQLDEDMQRREELQNNADFRKTVRMYEQIKPKQAKKMFQELLTRRRQDQVVTYLAAMNQRKAVMVLKQFKDPDEIVQATELLERLRSRGININAFPSAKEGTKS